MRQRVWEMNLVLGILTLLGLSLSPTVAEAKPNKQQSKEKKAPSDLLGAATSAGGTTSDLAASATHDGGGHGGETFFMYAHQPDKKEYEFGFKRGNGYHTIERYEKGGPHHNFKTKVRWHDSKGGHGEHYWDYNHAPKYHDDHHDEHHDDHHDGDHHGGGYEHDQHDGYGHHDDHGGYHSQPVPEFVPAASRSLDTTPVAASSAVPAGSSKPKIGKREGIARPSKVYETTDDYRSKQKPTKKPGNKVDVDKDSGQNKKHFHTYSEKQIFEYKSSSIPDGKDTEKVESPSAFPELLGFNPYLPPEIISGKYYPEEFLTGQQGSVGSQISSTSGVPSVLEHRTGQEGKIESASSSAKDNEASESIMNAQVSSVLPTALTLSLDTETGRIYDEATGAWFHLVGLPVEVQKEK